jgi:hypothetical protein
MEEKLECLTVVLLLLLLPVLHNVFLRVQRWLSSH